MLSSRRLTLPAVALSILACGESASRPADTGGGAGAASAGAGGAGRSSGGSGGRSGTGGASNPAGAAGQPAIVGGSGGNAVLAAGQAGSGGQPAPAGGSAGSTAGSAGVATGGSAGSAKGGSAGAATGGSGGAPAAGPVLPVLGCADTIAQVYEAGAPSDPPTEATRGDLLRCASDGAQDEAQIEADLADKGLKNDVPVTTPHRLYRVAYRTERALGKVGVSTARVYLPDVARENPLPLIVIAHPSEGVADDCAPSRKQDSLREVALPWAARGYAVIATDYAGLGNAGTQGYLDNEDSAHSLLDSARALRKLVAPGRLSSQIVLVGYSQGGGVALSAQGLASAYGSGGQVSAVVTFAAQWPSRLNSFDFVELLKSPKKLTITTGITKPVVQELLLYSYARNYDIPLDTLVPVKKAAGLANAADSLCLKEFGGYLQGAAVRLEDLSSDALRSTFLSCVSSPSDVGCIDPGKSLHAYLTKNIVKGDPLGGKILYVQGLSDTLMPPAEEGACNVAKLLADGVTPQVCTDNSLHGNVVEKNIVFAMKWTEAQLLGEALPGCKEALPACTP